MRTATPAENGEDEPGNPDKAAGQQVAGSDHEHRSPHGPPIETDHAKVSVTVTAAGGREDASFTAHFADHDGSKHHRGGHGH